MGRKRKSEEGLSKSIKVEKVESASAKMSPSKKKAKRQHHSDSDDSDLDDHHDIKLDPSVELDPSAMPPKVS